MTLTLVVLAAGAGRRYGGAKQFTPIGPSGESLLEYSVFDALRAGFTRAVLVVRPELEAQARERFAAMATRVPLSFVRQSPGDGGDGSTRSKPWGTGHAVLATESAVAGPFAVVNADDFYGAESFELLAGFLNAASDKDRLQAAMVGFQVAATLSPAGPVSRGLCRLDGDGGLAEIVEAHRVWRRGGRIVHGHTDGPEAVLRGDELVSMNLWGFSPGFFAELRRRFASFLEVAGSSAEAEFLLPEVVQALIGERRARVAVLPGAGDWCGITFREDEPRVKSRISQWVAEGRYPPELWV